MKTLLIAATLALPLGASAAADYRLNCQPINADQACEYFDYALFGACLAEVEIEVLSPDRATVKVERVDGQGKSLGKELYRGSFDYRQNFQSLIQLPATEEDRLDPTFEQTNHLVRGSFSEHTAQAYISKGLATFQLMCERAAY